MFLTQVIVTGELNSMEHVWLGALSDKLKKQNMFRLLESVNKLKGKSEREFGHEDLEIKKAIMQRYDLSQEEAEEYL